ncbi:MAG: hypothetical protein ACE5JM_11700 [Armatimonadota bacterium]
MDSHPDVASLQWTVAAWTLVVAAGAMLSAAADVTKASAPTEPLIAEVYDPGHPQADCSYHGVHCAGDGRVYFTLSAHSIAVWARVYEFDPKAEKLSLLWSADHTTPDEGHVPQSKIHSPLGELGGELYLCTHSGHYKTDHRLPGTDTVAKPYKGGYVCAVDVATGEGRVVAAPLHDRPVTVPMGDERVPLGGEGLITSVLDATRGYFYALSWPSAIFVKVDLRSGRCWEYGKLQDGAESVPRSVTGAQPDTEEANPHYQRCLRTLGLDDEGNVYGSSGDGVIWRYDLAQDKIVVMRARMEDGTEATDLAKLPAYLNMWRTVVWDAREKVFYGVHWASSWLFRFDPEKDEIEPVMHWAPLNQPVKDFAQLGLRMGPNHVLYGFVHASPLKANVQRSVHLLTLDLDSMRFKDHGHVLSPEGMTLMFAESCAVAPNGDVYTVGWMEIPEERVAHVTKLRREGGVPEVKYAFVMALVRIPAARVSLD